MAAIRVRARIRGRVQGVSFRFHTQEEARRLGLVGWVRNRYDGTVELEAEGPEAAVESLVRWALVGPPASRVDGVETSFGPPTGVETTFRILT